MNEANLKSYPKGISGNPSGRPKGSKNRATIAREILAMSAIMPLEVYNRIKEIFPGIERQMTVEQVATLALITRAITKGDHRAYKAVMDSAYGLPKQVIETDDITNKQKDPSQMTDEELDTEIARLEAGEIGDELLDEE